MRMLVGYLAPTHGQLSVNGCDLATDRLGAAASIGYLPENGPLYGDMTARDSLRFLAHARGLTQDVWRERLTVVTDQGDLGALLDKPIASLSKGQRQRVGMAQALLHDPPVLILDEPTAGLDPFQIRQFRILVRDLASHKTILVSTHILQEVDAIADRVLVMSRGQLLHDGTQTSNESGSLEQLFYDVTKEATADVG
jgi:ABC-2 type transport system ATP-binding protein